MSRTKERPEPQKTPEVALTAITGDTYPVRAQLRAMGALWDGAQRVWKIAPEKATQAQALVDHRPQEQAPPPPPVSFASDEEVLAALPDPFEESEQAPPLVALTGNTYGVKEALKALGARWDGERRAWLIREDKAEHARAIIENQAGSPGR